MQPFTLHVKQQKNARTLTWKMKEYSPEILPTIGCKHEVLPLMSLPLPFPAFSKIQFDLYYSLSML